MKLTKLARLENMDDFANILNESSKKCHDRVEMHFTASTTIAEVGLDIISEYCHTHGSDKLGEAIQQSIWGATNAR